ncbi:hypothetical protein VNO77_22322 [Canavalia gladiata]|uniref:Uncharacterized protein n=1 Tax=Canavalia gladiata TaxID=3824 RepID=A0AAN9Q7X0_CANGL
MDKNIRIKKLQVKIKKLHEIIEKNMKRQQTDIVKVEEATIIHMDIIKLSLEALMQNSQHGSSFGHGYMDNCGVIVAHTTMLLRKAQDRLIEARFTAPKPTQQAPRVDARADIPDTQAEVAGPSYVGPLIEIQFGFEASGSDSSFALFTSPDLSSPQTFFREVDLWMGPSFTRIEEGTKHRLNIWLRMWTIFPEGKQGELPGAEAKEDFRHMFILVLFCLNTSVDDYL